MLAAAVGGLPLHFRHGPAGELDRKRWNFLERGTTGRGTLLASTLSGAAIGPRPFGAWRRAPGGG